MRTDRASVPCVRTRAHASAHSMGVKVETPCTEGGATNRMQHNAHLHCRGGAARTPVNSMHACTWQLDPRRGQCPGPLVLHRRRKRADAAAAAGKRPTPVDVSDVGAAGSLSSRRKTGLAPASAVKTTAVVGAFAPSSATVAMAVVDAPEVRFQQGDKDYCVAYSAASAVYFQGDRKAAAVIYNMAALSLKQPVGVNRVKWVKNECAQRLQPGWRTLKLPNAQQMSKADLIALLATPDVVTVMQLEDSDGNIRHCVAAYGGWLFDPNKQRAVPLDESGLDACCLSGGTSVRAYAGFQLVRPVDTQAVPKHRGLCV